MYFFFKKKSDSIEDMCETDTFEDHLARMFPPQGQSPPWDIQRRYIVSDLVTH